MELIIILLIIVVIVAIYLAFYTRSLQTEIKNKTLQHKKSEEEIKKLTIDLENLETSIKSKEINRLTEKEDYEIRLKDEHSKQEILKENIKKLQEAILYNTKELQNLQDILKEEKQCKERVEKELFNIKAFIELKEQEEANKKAKLLEEKREKGLKILEILSNIEKKKRHEEAQRIIKEINELKKRRLEEEEIEKQRIKKIEEERKKHDEQEKTLKEEKIKEEEKQLRLLQNKFKSIGAKAKWEKVEESHFVYSMRSCYLYKVYANENIVLDKLFALFATGGSYNIYGQYFFYNKTFKCFINDINNELLLEITYEYRFIKIYFALEEETKIFSKENYDKQAKDVVFCYLENRKIKRLEDSLETIILNGIDQAPKLLAKGNSLEEKICSALESSNYGIDFRKEIESIKEKDMLVVNYELPNMSNFSEVKEYKYIASSKEIRTKTYTESYIAKRYENVLYSITLRSLYEIFSIDTENEINGITFNGFVTQVNPATGITVRKCILSIQVSRDKFLHINLSQVEPKACFKALKGVSAAKLVDISPITPILTFNKKDKRFVEGKDIEVNQGTNLAAMHWEDFEHLVRELFEMEFARNGGEVRVTQASRDGGVDAIVFDPDPLRGGKIVIQAKRYTNTVGVSAVRDLYGTVINEGANSGILITTSDYGHDSYEFAKDKPLKLLNGGHLLALLHKNGRTAHINIEEAKKIMNNN